MIIYLFFLILTLLPLIEGEFLGAGQFIFLAGCLPLSIYLWKKRIPWYKINFLFLLFLFFAGLATIFSPTFSRSLEKLTLYSAYFIYFLAAQVLVKEDKKQFRQLLIVSILFPSLILSLLSFYFLFISQPPPFGTMNLLFANFGHNHLVDFLILSFPLSLGLLIKEKNKFKKIAYLLMNLLFLVSFIFSFSRGGILIALFILLIFKFFSKKDNKDPNKYHMTASHLLNFSILILIFSLIFATAGYYYLGEDKIKLFNSFILSKTFRQPPFEIRADYWRQAMIALAKRPAFGWGLDSFRYTSKMFQKCSNCWSWYVHNHFLQMFAETGILGGLSFFVLIYLIFKKISFFKRKLDSFDFALRVALLASIAYSFFDYGWQFSSVFLFFWIITASLIKHKPKSELPTLVKLPILFLGILLFVTASLQLTANLYLFFGASKAKQEDFEPAEKYYQKSLSLWPFKLENWWPMIRFYEERKNFDSAISYSNKLIQKEPFNASVFQFAADLNLKQNKKALAALNHYQAFLLVPADFSSAFKLTDFLEKEPNLLTIDQIYLLLEQIEKHNHPKCILKCLEFENEKKIENLLLQLISAQGGSALGRKQNQFSQLNQDQQARVYFWLAVLTTYQKDWNQEIAFLNQALNLDPKKEYQDFMNDLLLLQKMANDFSNQNYDGVKKTASQFENKIKDHFFHQKFYLDEVYLWLSSISLNEGDSQTAQLYRRRALQINPWLEK